MKSIGVISGMAGLALMFGTTGCETTKTATATGCATVNIAAGEGSKGYIEFVSDKKEAAFPIFRIDEKQRAKMIGIIGLQTGDPHRLLTDETEVPVAESLRVALSPGTHTFLIQRAGPRVDIPVAQDKVTTVDIDYVRLESGERIELYRAKVDVCDPVPATR